MRKQVNAEENGMTQNQVRLLIKRIKISLFEGTEIRIAFHFSIAASSVP